MTLKALRMKKFALLIHHWKFIFRKMTWHLIFNLPKFVFRVLKLCLYKQETRLLKNPFSEIHYLTIQFPIVCEISKKSDRENESFFSIEIFFNLFNPYFTARQNQNTINEQPSSYPLNFMLQLWFKKLSNFKTSILTVWIISFETEFNFTIKWQIVVTTLYRTNEYNSSTVPSRSK